MLETITKKVSPKNEQHTIDVMNCFGWKLKSSQEVNVSDSHLENRYGDLYSVTNKEHYVKLLFEREKEMPNYDRIVKLEYEYYSILNSEPTFSKLILGVSFFASIFVSAMLLGLLFKIENTTVLIIGMAVLPCVYLGLYKRKHKKWQNMSRDRLPKILSAANSLL